MAWRRRGRSRRARSRLEKSGASVFSPDRHARVFPVFTTGSCKACVSSATMPAKASWLSDLKSELLAFPTGRHDDIVDALGLAGQLIDKWAAGPQPDDTVVRFSVPKDSRTTSSIASLRATAAGPGRCYEQMLRIGLTKGVTSRRDCKRRGRSCQSLINC